MPQQHAEPSPAGISASGSPGSGPGALRPAAVALGVAVLLSASFARPSGAQLPVRSLTTGDVVDGSVAGIVRASGVVQLAFTRSTFAGANETSRGVLTMRSTTGGRSFDAPVVASNRANAREWGPSLLETPVGRVLHLYFVSDETGAERLHWANSADGIAWNVSPSPLDLGLPVGTPIGKPAVAVLSPTQALLAFENRSDGTLNVSVLDDFITPRAQQTLGSGIEPSLLARGDGTFVLAYRRDQNATSIQVVTSHNGTNWSAPVTVLSVAERLSAPHLAATRHGSVSLACQRSTGNGGRIVRMVSRTPPNFAESWEVDLEAPDAAQPVLLPDPDSAPGSALYVVQREADGTAHVGRATTGSCDLAPQFAGLLEVAGFDSCGMTGIQLEWAPPASWGSGFPGYYEVHRGLPPAFEPTADTLIAISAYTWWFDDTVPPDTAFAYAVLARAEEKCSEQPGAGAWGLASGDDVQLASDGVSAAQPPPPVEGLLMGKGPAGLWSTWEPAPRGESYAVLTSPEPSQGFSRLAPPAPGTSLGLGTVDGSRVYFLAQAFDACGDEGPAN